MNKIDLLGLIALELALALAAETEVRAIDKHPLILGNPMVVAGVDLRAGVYDIKWQFQGARATVTFSRKGRVVATVQGLVSTLDKTLTHDTLFVTKHPDGFIAISGLGLAGTNRHIIFPVYPSPRHHTTDIRPDIVMMEESLRSRRHSRPLDCK